MSILPCLQLQKHVHFHDRLFLVLVPALSLLLLQLVVPCCLFSLLVVLLLLKRCFLHKQILTISLMALGFSK